MDERTTEDKALLTLLDLARDASAEPSAELLERVYSGATEELDRRQSHTPSPGRRRKRKLAGIAAAVGGWPALAGMATAMLAGIWIGISPPDLLVSLENGFISSETDLYFAELMPALDGFLEEVQ